MKALKIEDLEDWTCGEVVKHYKPDAMDEEIGNILFEQTCYPFSDIETINQLNELFKATP
jgi:hypothetical protein